MSELLVFFKRISHSLIFSQKTSNSNRKPMSPVPGNKEIIQQFFRPEFQMQQTFPGTKEISGFKERVTDAAGVSRDQRTDAGCSKQEFQMQQTIQGTTKQIQWSPGTGQICSRPFQRPIKYTAGDSRDQVDYSGDFRVKLNMQHSDSRDQNWNHVIQGTCKPRDGISTCSIPNFQGNPGTTVTNGGCCN